LFVAERNSNELFSSRTAIAGDSYRSATDDQNRKQVHRTVEDETRANRKRKRITQHTGSRSERKVKVIKVGLWTVVDVQSEPGTSVELAASLASTDCETFAK
jgi:hypothetical protein